jgi:hypothetical protein
MRVCIPGYVAMRASSDARRVPTDGYQQRTFLDVRIAPDECRESSREVSVTGNRGHDHEFGCAKVARLRSSPWWTGA